MFGFQIFGPFGSLIVTINVQNLDVRLVESINQMFEIRTVWEWDNFGKRRNPSIRISDSYCTFITALYFISIWGRFYMKYGK